MERKEDLVHELKRVKVIIGNGFDLYCGLKTSYYDFFKFCNQKYESIYRWVDDMASFYSSNVSLKKDIRSLYHSVRGADKINCWDVFFTLFMDRGRNYLWCDVEKEILDSLKLRDKGCAKAYMPHWEDVWEVVESSTVKDQGPGSAIMASMILNVSSRLLKTREQFYEYLLSELHKFEICFGYYITKQHVARGDLYYQFNLDYITSSQYLLSRLCNEEDITSIDCFNYGFTTQTKLFNKCKFINGDCRNPIFGVDSTFDPDDPRYIFTKTNRHIEQDMGKTFMDDYPEFDNAVVFGHSLNSHDYSYFYPILDQLEMTDNFSKRKLVIAYSIYDREKAPEIKKNVRKSLYSLFSAYSRYKGNTNEPARLLDSLTTQGRVLMYQIDPIAKPEHPFIEREDLVEAESMEEIIVLRWREYKEYGARY